MTQRDAVGRISITRPPSWDFLHHGIPSQTDQLLAGVKKEDIKIELSEEQSPSSTHAVKDPLNNSGPSYIVPRTTLNATSRKWTRDRMKAAIEKVIQAAGGSFFPTDREIRKQGFGAILQRFWKTKGLREELAKELGLELREVTKTHLRTKKKTAKWTLPHAKKVILELVKANQGTMPTQQWFNENGYGGLNAWICKRFGGVTTFAKILSDDGIIIKLRRSKRRRKMAPALPSHTQEPLHKPQNNRRRSNEPRRSLVGLNPLFNPEILINSPESISWPKQLQVPTMPMAYRLAPQTPPALVPFWALMQTPLNMPKEEGYDVSHLNGCERGILPSAKLPDISNRGLKRAFSCVEGPESPMKRRRGSS